MSRSECAYFSACYVFRYYVIYRNLKVRSKPERHVICAHSDTYMPVTGESRWTAFVNSGRDMVGYSPEKQMAEYGLIVALVAIVAISVWALLGSNVKATIDYIASCI